MAPCKGCHRHDAYGVAGLLLLGTRHVQDRRRAGSNAPAVIHLAARTVASHALSLFGDHSDMIHARTTGWAMLAASWPATR
jgi:hypothetical protein